MFHQIGGLLGMAMQCQVTVGRKKKLLDGNIRSVNVPSCATHPNNPSRENQTMKAIRIHAYGDASQMQFEEVPVPACGPNDVLVRVARPASIRLTGKFAAGPWHR